MRSGLAVEQEHRQPGRERGQDDDEDPGVDVDRPDEEGHAHPRHPGRAQPVDRHDEVDRADERRHGEDVQREDGQVDTVARVLLRERRVERPAGLSGASGREEAGIEHDAAEQEQPVREGVQAWERDVLGANHQRHEEVREAGQDRDDDEEDHRHAVDGHHFVVVLGREELLVRMRELRAHEHGQDPARAEEDEACDEVKDPDPLVVDGRDPGREAAAVPRHRVDGLGSNRHRRIPASGRPSARRAPWVSSRCRRAASFPSRSRAACGAAPGWRSSHCLSAPGR